MASKMLTFVTVGREMPAKRPASGRRRDFREIYARFGPAEAEVQAGRCSQCGDPGRACGAKIVIGRLGKEGIDGELERTRRAEGVGIGRLCDVGVDLDDILGSGIG